jgi:hypothetical protein
MAAAIDAPNSCGLVVRKHTKILLPASLICAPWALPHIKKRYFSNTGAEADYPNPCLHQRVLYCAINGMNGLIRYVYNKDKY